MGFISSLKKGRLKQAEEIRGALLLASLRFQPASEHAGADADEPMMEFFDGIMEFAEMLDEELNFTHDTHEEEPQALSGSEKQQPKRDSWQLNPRLSPSPSTTTAFTFRKSPPHCPSLSPHTCRSPLPVRSRSSCNI